MDAFGAKPFMQLRYIKIVHSSPKQKFCITFHAKGFQNAHKDNQISFWVKWSRMDAFGAKPFLQLRYTKIVHLGLNHKFCMFLRAEGFLNAPKHNQTSFGVQWSRMDAFWCETIFATSVLQNRALKPKTQMLHLFTCRRFFKCSKRQPNIN
jgi:hypothetical protein